VTQKLVYERPVQSLRMHSTTLLAASRILRYEHGGNIEVDRKQLSS